MPNIDSKKLIVDEIKEKVSRATSVVLVDPRGLTVAQDTALRKSLREIGVDYKVYKNRLMRLGFEGSDFAKLDEYLEGPSAAAFCYDDPTAAARVISKIAKDVKLLEFKAGVIENNVYNAEEVQAIANIPSREELLSKLLGSFKSPMSSFARIIQAIADKEGAPSAE